MSKVILPTVVILFAWIALPAHGATVYEWRDAQGVEHMSDTPPPGDQPGVTMRKIDGREVNSFDMGISPSEEAALMSGSSAPPAASPTAPPMSSPDAEAQCQREYGGPCYWVNNWEDYGNAECARTRDQRCHDRRHFEDKFHPRRVGERRPGEIDGTYEAVRHSADVVNRAAVHRR